MLFARAFVIAALIGLMAVSPLSAVIAPGEFDVRLGSYDDGLIVHLTDRTRLVRGLTGAPPGRGAYDSITNYGGDGRVLIVAFDGSSCDYLANLTFERAGAGFLISTAAQRRWCLGLGRFTVVAVHLWTPVDAASVQFASPE